MSTRAEAAFRDLNRRVLDVFGEQPGTVILHPPDGAAVATRAEWRQEPVTVEQGQSLVTGYQAILGVNLFELPDGTPDITTDWTVTLRGEAWEIADVRQPGDGWLVVQIHK